MKEEGVAVTINLLVKFLEGIYEFQLGRMLWNPLERSHGCILQLLCRWLIVGHSYGTAIPHQRHLAHCTN